MNLKLCILAIGVLSITNLTFAANVELNCEGAYAGKAFSENFKLSNERDPVTGGVKEFPAHTLGNESHYCGGSSLYFNLNPVNSLQLIVRSSQGCTNSDQFVDVLKTSSVKENEVNFQGTLNGLEIDVACSLEQY